MKIYILLYGAASIGHILLNSINRIQFEVVGFIDKRASEMELYEGLPVWDIGSVPMEYKNCWVYISVKNVFEHEKIYMKLTKSGMGNVIYKPYNVLMGCPSDYEKKISGIYDEIFAGKSVDFNLLNETDINKSAALVDYGLAREIDDKVVAYIPVEYIRTNNYIEGGMVKWGNVPICTLFTHISFFRNRNGLNSFKDIDNKDYIYRIDDYLNEYCCYTAELTKTISITDMWKQNVIDNRTQIYEQMRLALDLDPDFFVRNAAEAKWNVQRGFFNLLSGKHRASFLAAMGKHYIPLLISKSDYEIFKNYTFLLSIMNKYDWSELNTVIPNPYCYRSFWRKDDGVENELLELALQYSRKAYFEYGNIDLSHYSIWDCGINDWGRSARFLVKLGFTVYRQVCPSEFETDLNNLLFCNGIIYQSNICDSADIIIREDEKCSLVVEKYKIK